MAPSGRERNGGESVSIAALETSARSALGEQFGVAAELVARAPGRVELLGNHTDYNDGLVMSCAIDRQTVAVGARRGDRTARVFSVNLGEAAEFPIDGEFAGSGRWSDYVRGVVGAWSEAHGPLPCGFDLALAGDVPLGAGLSSSASLEVAVIWALRLLAGGDDTDSARMDLARLAQRAENRAVGVACGLLDPFSVLMAREGQALTLDCRTGDFERVPLGTGDDIPVIAVCDTMTSRRLAEGMYNRRREECERIVAHYHNTGAKALRDVSLGQLEADWDHLDSVGARRSRHVLRENERVRQGVDALRRGQVAALGQLMSASHASSRDDFENSSAALDALIAAAESAPGFLGGKLSGAGWAGCTVNLVRADAADAFTAAVKRGYADRTGIEPTVHLCRAAEGAAGAWV